MFGPSRVGECPGRRVVGRLGEADHAHRVDHGVVEPVAEEGTVEAEIRLGLSSGLAHQLVVHGPCPERIQDIGPA